MTGLETGSQTELFGYLSEPGVRVEVSTHLMAGNGGNKNVPSLKQTRVPALVILVFSS